MKFYMPMKLKKWGFKIHCLVDADGGVKVSILPGFSCRIIIKVKKRGGAMAHQNIIILKNKLFKCIKIILIINLYFISYFPI